MPAPYPLDRPWVKADHDPRCCCRHCMPTVVHSFHYRKDRAGTGPITYPCGRPLVGDPNAEKQIEADGAVHRTGYYSEDVNCPNCIEAVRQMFGANVFRDRAA